MLEDGAQTWHGAGDTDLQLNSTQMALNARGEGDVPQEKSAEREDGVAEAGTSERRSP